MKIEKERKPGVDYPASREFFLSLRKNLWSPARSAKLPKRLYIEYTDVFVPDCTTLNILFICFHQEVPNVSTVETSS